MRRGPRCGWAPAVTLLAALASVGRSEALETDQYYAWGRKLPDATDVMNAKVNLEIREVLERVNQHDSGRRFACSDVVKRIVPRFKWFIFQNIEMWAVNSPLVTRIPGTAAEELEYIQRYLYHITGLFDPGTKVPPSPTIEMNGVRLGTDKLAHFFSQGWWYYKSYRKARQDGLDRSAAELYAIRRGIFGEKTVLGWTWGIFSNADLEANYQGMRFLVGLCEGDSPTLGLTEEGWRQARPFDFRDWVTPEWDESYQPSMYGEWRWKRVRPVLAGYCPLLGDPEVSRRRKDYARRDVLTVTEREVARLVADGVLPDPRQFSLPAVCDEANPSPDPARTGSSSD